MLSSRVPMLFETMSVLFLLLVCKLTGVYSEDLTHMKNEENSLDGTTVTLSYNFSRTAASGDYFFWYRQYPGDAPQYLMYISGLGYIRTAESLGSDKRFSTKLTEDKTGVDLKISSAVVTDSALYYCAVRPTLIHSLISICCSSPECKGEDRVIQTREDVIATEGHTVSLRCTFETTGTNAYLFWYKQDVNDFPRFILSRFTYGEGLNAAEFNKDRFDAQIRNTSVPLRIQNLQLSDSALYYCGLRPTVTGNTDSLYQQTVHSIQDRVQALQGDKVTLSCNYSSANSFFWYLQYPSSHPQLLIKEYTELSGFTLKKDKEMFHLEISSEINTSCFTLQICLHYQTLYYY
ncbi:T cell receptor alpha variable 3 [Merluccius polli]|nr:T cell receptor alpha variable 3 [Merluccius polli]